MAELSKYHEVVTISMEQMEHFSANSLELLSKDGSKSSLIMSQSGYDALLPEQRARILKHVNQILSSPVPIIESVGGGSVRCCIAELF